MRSSETSVELARGNPGRSASRFGEKAEGGREEGDAWGLDAPALEGIHQLPWRVQAFAHQGGLLAHGDEGILEEAGLVLGRRGVGHGGCLQCRLSVRVLGGGQAMLGAGWGLIASPEVMRKGLSWIETRLLLDAGGTCAGVE